MIKLISTAAAVAVLALAASASPAAAFCGEIACDGGSWRVAKEATCLDHLDEAGRRDHVWCPDWSTLKDGEDVVAGGDCVFRQAEGGQIAWCPDWRGPEEKADCVFRDVSRSEGSVAWCPDWYGEFEAGREWLASPEAFFTRS